VIAGGRGRGTKPLMKKTVDYYHSQDDLNGDEFRFFANDNLTEAEVIEFIFKKEGIAQSAINKEKTPSTNTAENFTNSTAVLLDILKDVDNPTIAVVTSPPLLMRAKATAKKLWDDQVAEFGWNIKKFQTYPMSVAGLSNQELVDFMGYVAGDPEKYRQQYKNLNANSELKGTQVENNPNVKSVPLKKNDWARLSVLKQSFTQFLDTMSVSYDTNENHLKVDGAMIGQQNAITLNLDYQKVVAQSAKNKRVNYGVTVVAGHPFSGEAQDKIQGWSDEISRVTNGKFTLNADFVHASVGAIFRSQDDPISDEQRSVVDMEAIRHDVLPKALPYTINFTEVFLSDGKEGNLVLKGQAIGGNLNEIKRQLAEHGASLKWSTDADPDKPVNVFVTLGHINDEVLASFTEGEARALKNWIDRHKSIEPFSVNIDHLKIVTYKQRELKEMITADEEIPTVSRSLVNVMQERFDVLKRKSVSAVVYDLDYTLTKDKKITPELMGVIFKQRQLGVPVLIVTGRMYDPSPENREHGSTGLVDAQRDFYEFLEEKGVDENLRHEILSGLYFSSENGSVFINGFLSHENGFQRYDHWLSNKLGVNFNNDEERLKESLRSFTHSGVKRSMAKERSYTLYVDNRDVVLNVRESVIKYLKSQSLWDESKIVVSVTENTVEISFYNVTKAIAIDFIKEVGGAQEDEESVVLSIGDNGHAKGNDFPMLDRVGGLSNQLYDADNDKMIALSLLSGRELATPTTLWAVRQFKYKTKTGEAKALDFALVTNNAIDFVGDVGRSTGGVDFNAANLELDEFGDLSDQYFTTMPDIDPNTVQSVTTVITHIQIIPNFSLLLGKIEDKKIGDSALLL